MAIKSQDRYLASADITAAYPSEVDSNGYVLAHPETEKSQIVDLANATTSEAGLMSASDKTKLDGVATGANNYTHPTSGVTAGTYQSVTVDANGHVTAGTILTVKRSTAYAVGDIAYPNAATNYHLQCVKAGTTSASAVTYSTTDGALTTDGSCVWATIYVAPSANVSAENHNGIYRGADLTEYFNSGYMSTNIAAGKFVNIYIGDYIIKSVTTAATTYTNKSGTSVTQAAATYSNVKWRVAGIDPYWYGYNLQTHHLALMSGTTLQRNVAMNPTNDTTGAYLGSDMWTVHMPIWSAAVQSAFGTSHVLSHKELLANTINTSATSKGYSGYAGASSNWAWADVLVNIPNEAMVYGAPVCGSSLFDIGSWPRQLPLFALKGHNAHDDYSWFWLRAVVSSSSFAFANYNGAAYYFGASSTDSGGGIRPYFLMV